MYFLNCTTIHQGETYFNSHGATLGQGSQGSGQCLTRYGFHGRPKLGLGIHSGLCRIFPDFSHQ